MASRIGIELSPAACRIVEIDGQPAWARRQRDTRVRSFAVLPPSGPETLAKLESLRRRTAAVIVWTAPSEHRQVVVTGGSYESMRGEALAALAAAGLQTQGVVADIALVVGPARRGVRQPVIVALASASELSLALQPLRDAGVRLRTVTTPAIALGSLARLRRASSVPGAIEAYVALEQAATCIALVRDSVLIAARELPWGYAEGASGVARPREQIASRLAEGVSEVVAAVGGGARDLGQVCVCGGLPELRSMTAPLMERLDVEVEPLDSMFGIDATQVPEPAEEFRERGAELRLAWAVATDWPPPINLLRAQRRRTSKTMLARAAVAAGVAAGLVVGWRVEQSQWWQSTAPRPQARTAANTSPRGRAVTPAARATPPSVVEPSKPPVVAQSKPPAVTPPPAVAQNKPPVVIPPPRVEPPPTRTEPPAPRDEPPPRTEPRPARIEPVVPRPSPASARVKPAPQEVSLPFDAALGTILYSPDRKLAIIDGRIVGPGDEVRGARVTEITATAVMLRDAQGRLRRLALGAGAR